MTEQAISYLAKKVWVHIKDLTNLRARSSKNQSTLGSDIQGINTTSKQ